MDSDGEAEAESPGEDLKALRDEVRRLRMSQRRTEHMVAALLQLELERQEWREQEVWVSGARILLEEVENEE